MKLIDLSLIVFSLSNPVRSGGFSAAVRQMNMPRSTVCLQARALEADLCLRLLKRSTRTEILTPEGRQLFDEASHAEDKVSNALSNVCSHSGVLSRPIHFAVPADHPTVGLAFAVTNFKDLHPEVWN